MRFIRPAAALINAAILTLPLLCPASPGATLPRTADVKHSAWQDDRMSGSPLKTPPNGRIRVAFLLCSGAEVIDFAGPWGVFESVNIPGKDSSPFELFTLAESNAPITVSGGMRISPNYTFATAPQPNIIVIPAMGAEPSRQVLSWLRHQASLADLTMSVCNGAYLLAKAGLLTHKGATAYHASIPSLQADFPDVSFKRGLRFVDAGKISTSGGLTSGIDLAIHIVERYFGRKVAEKAAYDLEYQGQGWKDPYSNKAYLKRQISSPSHPLCPVCEMEVDPKTAPHEVFRGQIYYFCSIDEKKRFDRKPEHYVSQ